MIRKFLERLGLAVERASIAYVRYVNIQQKNSEVNEKFVENGITVKAAHSYDCKEANDEG